ncbi:MAG: xanthine dehydrogenase family protein molybdopterin-binding subunit [Phycisphaeraceae bacterium]
MSYQPDNRVAYENDGVRLDIVEKVTGKAKYTTDYYPQGLLWAGYIRCPYGKAELISFDRDAALAVPGVLEVEITKREGIYVGDRLGYLCAESRRAYERGMAALKLRFRTDRPKTDPDREMTPIDQIAPPDNAGEVAKVLDESDVVVEATYRTQVQTHCCLEPHIGLVDYRGDHAVAYGSTQGTFSFRDELADALGLKKHQVHFHCEYVGGGFGSKFGAGPEGQLAARMSKKYRRPCRVGLSRKEEQLDSGNRPGSIQYMKVGAHKDGRLAGARVHVAGVVGPSGGGGGARNPSRYDFGQVAKTHEDVHLNAGFPRAMRAPGHPQGMFAVELMMDELAEKLGIDPLQFRINNDPHATRRQMLKTGAELIGWDRRQPNGSGPGPVKRGLGVAVGDWYNSAGGATVTVEVYPDGTVFALSGSQDIGTGFRTMLADCVAHQLGVPRDVVQVRVGSSDLPPGPASGGSVTSRFVAPKALGAADQARRKIIELVAQEWQTDPGGLSITDGIIRNGTREMAWDQACQLITDDRLTFTVSEDGSFRTPPTDSDAVQFAEVEVDTETGIVRVLKIVALQDVGQAVNRHTVENQITGAVIQGLSFALFEDRLLDPTLGAMVNPNMEYYKIAGPKDVPEVVPVIWVSREDASVNSLGEPPVVPTPGAIACAVYNAIGVPVRSMPITPARVLAALGAVKGGRA